MKRAICVVSVGTTCKEAIERCIVPVEHFIKEQCEDADVFRAFSSKGVAARLKKRQHSILLPEELLNQLKEDGYTHIDVVPTHIFNGVEYKDLAECVEQFKVMYPKMNIALGRPLIETKSDIEAIVKALEAHYLELSENEALVIMGHEIIEDAMNFSAYIYEIMQQTNEHFYYVTNKKTMHETDALLQALQVKNVEKVCLVPLMLTAGVHVQHDLAGTYSWRSILSDAGIKCQVFLKGLGEFEEIIRMYGEKFAKLHE